jgi:putative heavy-metal-binding protein
VVCELDVLTEAWNTARRQALDRLADEAVQAGADAVVGVTVQQGDHDLGRGLIEYVVSGTAIRLPASTGEKWPVLTSLSVQDYWRLHTSGHEPAGFLGASVVTFASAPRATRLQRLRTQARNQELEELSRAFHLARDSVRIRLRGQVMDARGWGAVGVRFEHTVARDSFHLASSLQTADHRGWNRGRFGLPYYVSGHSDVDRTGWVITMHAVGTAVKPPARPPAQAAKTAIRMSR